MIGIIGTNFHLVIIVFSMTVIIILLYGIRELLIRASESRLTAPQKKMTDEEVNKFMNPLSDFGLKMAMRIIVIIFGWTLIMESPFLIESSDINEQIIEPPYCTLEIEPLYNSTCNLKILGPTKCPSQEPIEGMKTIVENCK